MSSSANRYLFYGLKLPCMLILMLFGFVMEYLVELPFNLMTRLDPRSRRTAKSFEGQR